MQFLKEKGFKIDKKIGFGYASNVFRIIGPEQQEQALKWINHVEKQSNLKMRAQLQAILLRDLSHPGVIKSREAALHSDKTLLFLEYCPKGNMRQIEIIMNALESFGLNKSTIIKYYLAQIVSILLYLKKMGVIHRDIKLQNFVLTNQYKIKLIDFGFSKLGTLQKTMSNEALELNAVLEQNRNLVGSRHYFSPEMIGPEEKRIPTYQIDVWCLGILAYKLMLKFFPFHATNRNFQQTCSKILESQPQYLNILPEEEKEFLSRCLQKDPSKRIKIQEIPSLSIFSGIPIETIFSQPSPIDKILNPQKYQKQIINVECKMRNIEENKFHLGQCFLSLGNTGKKYLIFKTFLKKNLEISFQLDELLILKQNQRTLRLEDEEGRAYFLKFSDEDKLNQVIQSCIKFSQQ